MRHAIVVTATVIATWGMPTIARGQGQATAMKTDQAFVTDAARANMAEVAIALRSIAPIWRDGQGPPTGRGRVSNRVAKRENGGGQAIRN
jgi:hypothetical protein